MFNNTGFFQIENNDTNKYDKEDFFSRIYSSKSPSAIFDTNLDTYSNLIVRKNPVYYLNGSYNIIKNENSISGSATYNTSILNNNIPYSYSTAFTSGTQKLTHNLDFVLNNKVTFCLWIYLTSVAGSKNIFSIKTAQDLEIYKLYITNDELVMTVNNGAQTLSASSTSLDLLSSTLYLITIEVNNNNILIYKNSTLIHTITNTLAFIPLNEPNSIIKVGDSTVDISIEGLAILYEELVSSYIEKLYESGNYTKIKSLYNSTYDASVTSSKPKQGATSVLNNSIISGLNIQNNLLQGYKTGGVFSHSNALSAFGITNRAIKTDSDNDYIILDSTASDYLRMQVGNRYVTMDGYSGKIAIGDSATVIYSPDTIYQYNTTDMVGFSQSSYQGVVSFYYNGKYIGTSSTTAPSYDATNIALEFGGKASFTGNGYGSCTGTYYGSSIWSKYLQEWDFADIYTNSLKYSNSTEAGILFLEPVIYYTCDDIYNNKFIYDKMLSSYGCLFNITKSVNDFKLHDSRKLPINFNGTSSYVTITSRILDTLDNFSIIIHVKIPTNATGKIGLFSKEGLNNGFNLIYDADTNRFDDSRIYDANGYLKPNTTTYTLKDNSVHQIILTFDKLGSAHLMIDGVNRYNFTYTGTSRSTLSIKNTTPLIIGKVGTYYMLGDLKHIAIYDKSLGHIAPMPLYSSIHGNYNWVPINVLYRQYSSNGVITSNSSISDGNSYVCYGGEYAFSYTGSNNTKNYNRKTYNGTKGGSTKLYNTPGSQRVNYIYTSDLATTSLGSNFITSINFFIQSTQSITTPAQCVYWYSAADGNNFLSYAYIENNILYYSGRQGSEINTGLKIIPNVPYFITIDHLYSTVRLYVNGKFYNEYASSANFTNYVTYPYRYIGAWYTTGSKEDFNGVIDYFNFTWSGETSNIVNPFNNGLLYFKTLSKDNIGLSYEYTMSSVFDSALNLPFNNLDTNSRLSNYSGAPLIPNNNASTITKYNLENIPPGETCTFYKWPISGDPYYITHDIYTHPQLLSRNLITSVLLDGDFGNSATKEYIIGSYTPSQGGYSWDFLYKQYSGLYCEPGYGWSPVVIPNVFSLYNKVPILVQVVQDSGTFSLYINNRLVDTRASTYYQNSYNKSYFYVGRAGNTSEAWRYGMSKLTTGVLKNNTTNVIMQSEALLSNSFRRYLIQLNPTNHYICNHNYNYMVDIADTNHLTVNTGGTLVKVKSGLMTYNDSILFYTGNTNTYLKDQNGLINTTGSSFSIASVLYINEYPTYNNTTERILFSRTGSTNSVSSYKLTYFYKPWLGYLFKLYYYIGGTQYTYTMNYKDYFDRDKPATGDTVFVALVYNEASKYFQLMVNDCIDNIYVGSPINKSTDADVEFRVNSDKLTSTISTNSIFPSEIVVYGKALSTLELNELRKEFNKNKLNIRNIYTYNYSLNPLISTYSNYGIEEIVPKETYNTILNGQITSNTNNIVNITTSLSDSSMYKLLNMDNDEVAISTASNNITINLSFYKEQKVNVFKIKAGSYNNNYPLSLTVLGSNDGNTFTHLATKYYNSWNSKETRYFSFNNEKTFKYYRIILPWYSGNNTFNLCQLIPLNELSDSRYNIPTGITACLVHSSSTFYNHIVTESSNSGTDYQGYQAFNNYKAASWYCWASASGKYNATSGLPISGNGEWVQYKFPEKRLISGFLFVTRNDGTNRGDPKEITVYGSNNGVNYDNLGTYYFDSSYAGSNKTSPIMYLNNTNYYSYYKFEVNKTYPANSQTYASISMLYMFNSAEEIIGAIQAHKPGKFVSNTGRAIYLNEYSTYEYPIHNAFNYSTQIDKAAISHTSYPHEFGYAFNSPKIITKYAFAVRYSNQYSGRPNNWTFLGSNDGTSWTTLDTKSSIADKGINSYYEYTISNTTAFKYYKINITSSHSQSYSSFAHFKLYE